MDKSKECQTFVSHHILKKLQACHQTGGRIFYFVPDLGSAWEDAVWPAAIFAISQDGIVLELLKLADYFITTKEAISSKGIDYMDTFGGGVLSGLEYDIFADV